MMIGQESILIFCKGMVFVNITGRFNAIQKTLAVVLDENCPTRPTTTTFNVNN